MAQVGLDPSVTTRMQSVVLLIEPAPASAELSVVEIRTISQRVCSPDDDSRTCRPRCATGTSRSLMNQRSTFPENRNIEIHNYQRYYTCKLDISVVFRFGDRG